MACTTLLTQVDEPVSYPRRRMGGWELPSQFMENFCWEWTYRGYDRPCRDRRATAARMPYDKMIAAKNFQSGMQTLRQIEFALFDLPLHSESGSGRDAHRPGN